PLPRAPRVGGQPIVKRPLRPPEWESSRAALVRPGEPPSAAPPKSRARAPCSAVVTIIAYGCYTISCGVRRAKSNRGTRRDGCPAAGSEAPDLRLTPGTISLA